MTFSAFMARYGILKCVRCRKADGAANKLVATGLPVYPAAVCEPCFWELLGERRRP